MGLLYILAVGIGLLISYFIANEFKKIAELKGYGGGKYFWFTFLFGIVGMLMVVALPNKREKVANEVIIHDETANNDVVKRFLKTEVNSDNVEPNQNTHKWLCDYCGKMRSQSPCEFCGKE